MILVVGALAESATTYVCALLARGGDEFALIDTRKFGRGRRGFDVTFGSDGARFTGTLRNGTRTIDLAAVRSAYVQFVYVEKRGARGSVAERSDPAATATLIALAETLPGLVLNRPSACATNASKPLQAAIIARHGFLVPRTLITSDPAAARAFIAAADGRAIFKSISGQRSIVQRVQPSDVRRLAAIRNCPTQFQELVPGVDVRVHVVGERTFATEIETDAVDYRYASRERRARAMRGAALPDDVERRCLELAQDLGLVTCGVDLRRTPDGRWCCFEVNPNPGFTFYENQTGQPIGAAIVDLLRRGRAR